MIHTHNQHVKVRLVLVAILFAVLSAMAKPLPKIGPRLVLNTSSNRMPDDMCIWVHPDPDKGVMSTVITVDPKAQTVQVFDLNGRVIDSHRISKPIGVDVRYNFPLGDTRIDIVAFHQSRGGDRLIVMKVDPTTRKLSRVDDNKSFIGKSLAGCIYHNINNGKFFYITACKDGKLKWFELKDNGQGRISTTKVAERQYVYTACSAIAADDDYGRIYFSERSYGLWSAPASPQSEEKHKLVHKAGTKGLERDVEGVGIYSIKGGAGYIVVTSESNNRFVLFDRRNHNLIGSFLLRGVNHPEGLEVANSSLGRYYPSGILLCTTKRDNGRKKILATPWDAIARSFKPKLLASPSWNPRIIKGRVRKTTTKKGKQKVTRVAE